MIARISSITLLTVSAGLAAGTIAIHNEHMEVALDAAFPRVIEYQIAGKQALPAALSTSRPAIRLNGSVYTPNDWKAATRFTGSEAHYSLAFPDLKLTTDWQFRLDGSELHMQLLKVQEQGEFRLQTIDFPDQYLIRMPALFPGAMAYRGEYKRTAWKEKSYRGGWGQSQARIVSIKDEDGEANPLQANFAAAYADGICATIANNIGYWKLATQFLGYDARASDFALWNGTYHYRLRGAVQPLLDTHVAVLTSDANHDGKVDWMEAALWHRKSIRAPNAIYAGPTYVYKVINAWGPPPPNNEPVTTFDETLQIVKRVAALTGGMPQLVYLVGWQFEGHDSGYPSLDRVNPQLGGAEKLRTLAREAKQYNATISYHINLDDAYQEYPGWDEKVLCLGRDGKPYPWIFYSGPGVHLQAYHISHTKELETGYFEKRARAFLDAVPVEKTLHLDTFRYSNLSFEPNNFIDMNEELVLGCNRIFQWFTARGIDITSEGPYDGFYGTLSYFWHWLSAVKDPFHVLMIYGKAYGGGKPGEPVGNILGWSEDRGFQAHPHKYGRVFSTSDALDTYYLGTLLQYYLSKKQLVYLGPQGDGYAAKFEDGSVSSSGKDGTLLVRSGEVTIASGQDRFIPISDSEIRLYSVSGGDREWVLPRAWQGARVSVKELREDGAAAVDNFHVENLRLRLTMQPRRPYVLRKG